MQSRASGTAKTGNLGENISSFSFLSLFSGTLREVGLEIEREWEGDGGGGDWEEEGEEEEVEVEVEIKKKRKKKIESSLLISSYAHNFEQKGFLVN